MANGKPSYGTSKKALWISSALAWMTIFLLIAGGLAGRQQAVELAGIIVPSMVFLIAAMLGIHRFSGSMDFRAAQGRQAEPACVPSAAGPVVEGEFA